MIEIKTLKQARSITGGISNKNRKMPFYSYGLPVKNCITGSKLAKIKKLEPIDKVLTVEKDSFSNGKAEPIANLISEYHPDLVTNATVNLEEIFSSF